MTEKRIISFWTSCTAWCDRLWLSIPINNFVKEFLAPYSCGQWDSVHQNESILRFWSRAEEVLDVWGVSAVAQSIGRWANNVNLSLSNYVPQLPLCIQSTDLKKHIGCTDLIENQREIFILKKAHASTGICPLPHAVIVNSEKCGLHRLKVNCIVNFCISQDCLSVILHDCFIFYLHLHFANISMVRYGDFGRWDMRWKKRLLDLGLWTILISLTTRNYSLFLQCVNLPHWCSKGPKESSVLQCKISLMSFTSQLSYILCTVCGKQLKHSNNCSTIEKTY